MEYAEEYAVSVELFNPKAISDNICGQETKPTRTKQYIFDPKELVHTEHNKYALHRTFASYTCDSMVATMESGYKLWCSPSSTSYAGMACMAESHSYLKVSDSAFLPTGPDIEGMNHLSQLGREKHNNCTLCEEVLRSYQLMDTKASRRRFNATTEIAKTNITTTDTWFLKTAAVIAETRMKGENPSLVDVWTGPFNVSQGLFYLAAFLSILAAYFLRRKHTLTSGKRYGMKDCKAIASPLVCILLVLISIILPFDSRLWAKDEVRDGFRFHQSSSAPLRIDDANYLLHYARKMYAKGGAFVWDALAAATVARRLLHAGQPDKMLMREGGLLYQAIVDYNQYLVNVVEAVPEIDPTPYTYVLKGCPQHMDNSYSHLAARILEPILPSGRNFGFNELDLLVDMNPYRVLASFPEVSSRHYRKKVLIDVGTNGFMGSAKALLDMHAPYMSFDEVHMFEPHSMDMDVPNLYSTQSNITYHRKG